MLSTMESVTRRLEVGNFGRIARRCGITKQHVSRVLRGESGVSLIVAWKIAEAAGVTLNDLWEHIAASGGPEVKNLPKAAA